MTELKHEMNQSGQPDCESGFDSKCVNVSCDAVMCLTGIITILFKHVKCVRAPLKAERNLLALGAAVCSGSEASFVNLLLKEHAVCHTNCTLNGVQFCVPAVNFSWHGIRVFV